MSDALALDPKSLARRKELIERFEALKPGDARPALAFAAERINSTAPTSVHTAAANVITAPQ